MTAIIARSPLQILSMTSMQRPSRRRNARHAFEEEEGNDDTAATAASSVPVKKAKVDDSAKRIINARAGGKAVVGGVGAGKKNDAGKAAKLIVFCLPIGCERRWVESLVKARTGQNNRITSGNFRVQRGQSYRMRANVRIQHTMKTLTASNSLARGRNQRDYKRKLQQQTSKFPARM